MQKVNFEEELKKLLEVQKLDEEIYNIKRELEEIPGKLAEYDRLIKEKEGMFKESDDRLKRLLLKKKDQEIELNAKEESIKKHQAQLLQLKTNQEYTAMQKEINSITADRSVLEEEIINLFDEIESAEKKLKEDKENYQAEKTNIEAEKKKVDEGKKKMEGDLANIEGQRAELVKGVNKEILSKYERILKAKDGCALVKIEHDSCGGCNMTLPPQVIDQVKMKRDMILCGNCSRVLYSEE